MVDIKRYLKNNDIQISYVANALDISRPTLDTYINYYQNRYILPNKNMQMIFRKLFDEPLSVNEFEKTLNAFSEKIKVKRSFGMENLDLAESDVYYELFRDIIDDSNSKYCDKNIYLFIKFIVKEYKNNPSLIDLANYFLTLNLITDINDYPYEVQCKLGLYYEAFKNIKVNQKLNYNEKTLAIYKEKIANQNLKIEQAKHQANKFLNSKISEILRKEINNGVDVSKYTADDIIKLLKNI